MPTPARVLALNVLIGLAHSTGTLADRLAASRSVALPAQERDFLHELVLGTLRRRGLLDFHLRAVLGRPVHELRPAVLADILRLGAHQILHLRVPAHAAVSEAVELAAQHAPRAKGLVNAVLRRLAREGPARLPDPANAPIEWLTSAGSLPPWLAERWVAAMGAPGALARAAAMLDAPAVTFRLNPRIADAWQQVLAAGLAPEPLTVPGAFRATRGRAFELASRAVIALQDEGSQLVAHLAAHGPLVLDACAAPGGKAMLIGDLLGAEALVVAAEVSWRRLRTMRRLVGGWGTPNVLCLGADGLTPPFRAQFDTVLIDAPCSGLGTIARHPDIRWRLVPRDIKRHARRQQSLLAALAPCLRPGGLLVYSTCSLEEEETSQPVAWLLHSHRQLRLAPTPRWAAPYACDGTLRVRPEQHGGDGFFAAAFQRA